MYHHFRGNNTNFYILTSSCILITRHEHVRSSTSIYFYSILFMTVINPFSFFELPSNNPRKERSSNLINPCLKNSIFWDMTPCILIHICHIFEEVCCLVLQGIYCVLLKKTYACVSKAEEVSDLRPYARSSTVCQGKKNPWRVLSPRLGT